ncbi:hypothetical protein ACLOJK_000933 [Asimina triloba]
MAYQEFGDGRRGEAQKRKIKILIGVGLTVLLLIFIAAGAFAVVERNDDDSEPAPKKLSTSNKAVKVMCESTDYKKHCESSLKQVLKNHDDSDPKNIIKAAIMVVIEEVVKAFSNSTKLKSKDPEVNAAIQDCMELFGHAKDELLRTLSYVDTTDIENLPEKSHDIRTWLSAVMSYQQTCVDGFPDGETKEKANKVMMSGRELTSNALAIIQQASSILTMLDVQGFRRRLLEAKDASASHVGADGLPDWMSEEERRFLAAKPTANPKPNVIVAKDGSGDFNTINAALNAMPKKYTGRYVIYIKEGIYEETVNITKKMTNVTMYGDGSRKTIVTGSKNYIDGVRTYHTATVAAVGEGFFAKAIAFRNTAGAAKHQAVALRVQSDRSVFLNCRMEGYQDTLYTQTHRQFYRSCVIAGTIDFIFGDAAVVFQNCKLVVRKPLENQQNIVTAQGRVDRHENTGIVIQNCQIVPDKKLSGGKKNITVRNYLGRPWKEFSRTIVMESNIGALIHPDGWLPWEGDFALKTLYYGEYNNKGDGADTSKRVKWRGRKDLSMDEAMRYTVENFIDGTNWIRSTGTPVQLSLFHMRGFI